jgi:hypothetical protein
MCTVSIIPRPAGGFRMVCNRDEQRSRPAALPPEVRTFGGLRAILPIDPAGGGTWVAVNEAGLALTLLNVNHTAASRAGNQPTRRSRGRIIPTLLGSTNVPDAVARFAAVRLTDHDPFRLVVADPQCRIEITSDGRRADLRRNDADRPLMFTSSGLGDRLVAAPRRDLFDQLVAAAPDLAAAQDAFHRHRWPRLPHLSVDMCRADARTVSRTVVEVSYEAVSMRYASMPEARQHVIDPHVILKPQI